MAWRSGDGDDAPASRPPPRPTWPGPARPRGAPNLAGFGGSPSAALRALHPGIAPGRPWGNPRGCPMGFALVVLAHARPTPYLRAILAPSPAPESAFGVRTRARTNKLARPGSRIVCPRSPKCKPRSSSPPPRALVCTLQPGLGRPQYPLFPPRGLESALNPVRRLPEPGASLHALPLLLPLLPLACTVPAAGCCAVGSGAVARLFLDSFGGSHGWPRGVSVRLCCPPASRAWLLAFGASSATFAGEKSGLRCMQVLSRVSPAPSQRDLGLGPLDF